MLPPPQSQKQAYRDQAKGLEDTSNPSHPYRRRPENSHKRRKIDTSASSAIDQEDPHRPSLQSLQSDVIRQDQGQTLFERKLEIANLGVPKPKW